MPGVLGFPTVPLVNTGRVWLKREREENLASLKLRGEETMKKRLGEWGGGGRSSRDGIECYSGETRAQLVQLP